MQYPNKAFVFTLCWSVTAEVIWLRVKWGKVWSQSFTLWLTLCWRDTSVRLCSRPSSSSSATTFDKSLSATNFAQPPKLLTLQPLEAGSGVSAPSRRDSRLPRGRGEKHLIQRSTRWPVAELRNRRGPSCRPSGTPAVCGCAVGSSWLVNGSGSGKRGVYISGHLWSKKEGWVLHRIFSNGKTAILIFHIMPIKTLQS